MLKFVCLIMSKEVIFTESRGKVASGRRLPFYLAAEEYLAARRPDEPLFLLWQVGPTVIFGRNQDPASELDIDWCEEHGVEYYRRKSGGGCVYADWGNLMISCIYPGAGVKDGFARFSSSVCEALRSLGFAAEVSGRNDILVRGRKVSGAAFFALPSVGIVHSTMLLDADPASMQAALKPSAAKLGAKGVKSVSSRICTLREFRPDLRLDVLAGALRTALSAQGAPGSLLLDESDVAEIERIESTYLDRDFIMGRHGGREEGSRTVAGEGYVEGCGFIKAEIQIVGNKILNVSINGDFFTGEFADGLSQSPDLSETLSRLLAGEEPTREAVAAALGGIRLEEMVSGLTSAAFVDILFRNC